MPKKLHLTFRTALKKFFKTFRWLYYLGWLGFICILPLGLSHELLLPIVVWALLPLLAGFMFSISPALIFDNKELIIHHPSFFPKITPIKYNQINYINIAKAPEEISIIYQTSNTKTHTIKIFPNNYDIPFAEILSYFPADIPVIEKED